MNERNIERAVRAIVANNGGKRDPKQMHLLQAMVRHVYYDLVRVEFHDELLWHLPATFFLINPRRVEFYKRLPMSQRQRDDSYFRCPACDTPRFYDGPCPNGCQRRVSGRYRDMKRREAQLKERFLRVIDRGELPENIKLVDYVRSTRKEE